MLCTISPSISRNSGGSDGLHWSVPNPNCRSNVLLLTAMLQDLKGWLLLSWQALLGLLDSLYHPVPSRLGDASWTQRAVPGSEDLRGRELWPLSPSSAAATAGQGQSTSVASGSTRVLRQQFHVGQNTHIVQYQVLQTARVKSNLQVPDRLIDRCSSQTHKAAL